MLHLGTPLLDTDDKSTDTVREKAVYLLPVLTVDIEKDAQENQKPRPDISEKTNHQIALLGQMTRLEITLMLKVN